MRRPSYVALLMYRLADRLPLRPRDLIVKYVPKKATVASHTDLEKSLAKKSTKHEVELKNTTNPTIMGLSA
jgi:hypothetical protein